MRSTPENADRVINSLSRFGMRRGTNAEDFTNSDIIFQIGFAPCRIDLVTSIDGVTFEEAIATRVIGSFDGIPVPVLSRDNLLKNKRAAGRPKDLADVAWLEQTGGRDPR